MSDTSQKPITLIATIGSSPAVLTEALWALYQKGDWPVKEIYIITTTHGKNRINDKLFNHQNYGGYYKLCDELNLEPTDILCHDYIIPEDENLNQLDDIRNQDDDQRFANVLQELVRKLTANQDKRVFALLSGGRKTMGARLFSAMQLFANPNDQVLHVLVNEPFDNNLDDFFFPTRETVWIEDRKGNKYNASKANVDLIYIPFLHLRGALKKTTLNFDQPYFQLKEDVEMQLQMSASQPVRMLYIKMDRYKGNNVYINEKNEEHGFHLAPRPLSILSYLALKNKIEGEIAQFQLKELDSSLNRYKLHLCYHATTKKETEDDDWFKNNIDKRNFTRSKTSLKNQLKNGISKLGNQTKLNLRNILDIQSAQYVENVPIKLPIPPSNISLSHNNKNQLRNYIKDDLSDKIKEDESKKLLRFIDPIESDRSS
ncbi:MAG TPA: CRISPR-associated ring nuclease Csm6 [Balneolales bacterium]|nr:CRISPR-associated ring nuclease Csm6 [Balneolales bacterium]